MNFEIADIYEADYADKLFQAVQVLYRMRDEEGHKVFLHCTTGVSRGPTLMLVYMALYIKTKDWNNMDSIYDYMEG